MNNLLLGWLLAGVVALNACSAKDSGSESGAPMVPRQTAGNPAAKESTEQSPRAAVSGFLAWYKEHYGELMSIPIVPASFDEDTTNVYVVDFDEAKVYVETLRVSGFISESYIRDEMRYMRQADSVLRANPVKDGPPDGFNYDRIVFSQDPEADLDLLIRTTAVVTSRADSAQAVFSQLPKPEDVREGGTLVFGLSRHKGKWLIDTIQSISSEPE